MDEQELAAIDQMHVPDPAYRGRVCAACGVTNGRWPCDAHELVAEVRRLRAAVDGLTRTQTVGAAPVIGPHGGG